MNKQRGFTIIELIVVIAIIAVLAGIVLVNVTQYINKGKDASAKGSMSTLLTNSAVYFDTNPAGTGSGFLSNPTYATPVFSALGSTNMGYASASSSSSTDWCAMITLKAGPTFCVDGTGSKIEKTGGACTNGLCVP